MWEYNNTDELYHYGILGMRWGKRKGSTPKIAKKRKTVSVDYAKAKRLGKKKLSQLSNKELQDYNSRKNLERNYKSFKPKHIAIGIASVGTAAGLLGNYKNIKSNFPEVVKDGRTILSKMRNIRLR